MTQTLEEILAGYEGLRADQEAFYQDLHRHPELSHQEHDTAGRVAERLRGDGFTVQAGIGGTGVVGVLAMMRRGTRCPSLTPAATTCTCPA